jgi:hypothetical protein
LRSSRSSVTLAADNARFPILAQFDSPRGKHWTLTGWKQEVCLPDSPFASILFLFRFSGCAYRNWHGL